MKNELANRFQTKFGEVFEHLSLMPGEQDTAVLIKKSDSIGTDISHLRFEMSTPNQPLPHGKWTVISDFLAIREFAQANKKMSLKNVSFGLNQEGRVFSIVTKPKEVVSTEGLNGLPYLTKLAVLGAAPLACDDLTTLSQLKELQLCYSKPKSFEFLSGLKNLQEFDAYQTGLNDLSIISGLRSLETLSFGDNGVTDLTPLIQLKNLRFLEILDERIRDLSPLAQLPELVSLKIISLPPQDLSFLLTLPKLRHVSFSAEMIVRDCEKNVSRRLVGQGWWLN